MDDPPAKKPVAINRECSPSRFAVRLLSVAEVARTIYRLESFEAVKSVLRLPKFDERASVCPTGRKIRRRIKNVEIKNPLLPYLRS